MTERSTAAFTTMAPRSTTMDASDATGDSIRPLDGSPMSRAQFIAISVAVLLATLDGYDALSMSFVAPAVSLEWALDKATLGILLSSGLFGMAAGALVLSPLADVAGRKPVVLGGVSLMAVGSLLSAFCHSVPELVACRVITGLGIGVMVALTTSIAAEFANARNRPLAVAATTVGFSMGGVVGGLASALLLRDLGWIWIFVVGAIAAAALLPLVVFSLPESPAFIITRRPANALRKLNQVLVHLAHPPVTMLPPAPVVARASYGALFTRDLAGTTLKFTAVYALIATTAYYMLSWLPQMVADAGFPPSKASVVLGVASLVGIVGAVTLGAFARKAVPARIAAGAMVGLGAAVVAFGLTPPLLPALILSASAFGFFLSGATAVFYATMATGFPPLTRVSGIGFVMGIGRVLSAAGPTFAGWMFAAGLTRADVSLVFAAGAVIGGLLLMTHKGRHAAI